MRPNRITIAIALSALLAACGGGSQQPSEGGSGAESPSLASGTVTGFGPSLDVDGVSYDASAATVSDDTDPANPSPATLADLIPGQQVDLTIAPSGKLTHVGIGASIAGLVDPGSVDTAASRFTVLGQTVTYALSGPAATVFVGALDAARPLDGRLVKVHGSVDTQGVIAARLVVVMPEGAPLLQRVRGVVAGTDAVAGTFRLGRLTVAYRSARLLPQGAQIEDGASVVVFSRQPAAGTAPELLLTADTVHVLHVHRQPVVVRLGGPITAVTPVDGRVVPDFEMAGLKVDASGAKLAGGTAAGALVVGAIVRVEGTVEAGVVHAATIAVVRDELERVVVLSGPISRFAGVGSFVVRGAEVDGSSAEFTPGSSAAQLADGVAVTVLGRADGARVVAERITVHLPPPPPPPVELTLAGVVARLDAEAGTFRLSGIEVRLADGVSYQGGTAADLADGAHVKVTGARDGGALVAKRIEFLGKACPATAIGTQCRGPTTGAEPSVE